MANTSTKKVNNSNYLNSTMKKVNNVIKEKETDPDEFLNTNKRLNKAEKKQAQKVISDYYDNDIDYKVKDTAKHMQSSNPYLARKFREQNMTEDEQKEFLKMRALEAKAGKGENVSSFFAGAVEKLPFFKQIAKAYDKAFGYDDETSATSGLENAKTQSPIANTAGQFATTAMEYAMGNEALAGVKGFDNAAEATTKALSGVPMLNKLSTNTVANLMRGQAADTLIDTIPELANNISEGKDGKEIAKDLLKNQATNLAFNVGAEALPSLVGKLLKNKSTNEVIENAIKESDDVIANATKDANNAVDAVKKSSEELPQIAPEVVKEAEVKPQEIPTLLKETEAKPQTDVVNNAVDATKNSDSPLPKANVPKEVEMARETIESNQMARGLGMPVDEEQDAIARQIIDEYNNKGYVLPDANVKEVPQLPSKTKQRGYAESIQNKTDLPEDIKAEFDNDLYRVLSNAETSAKADANFSADNMMQSISNFNTLLRDRDAAAIPLGSQIAKELIATGDNGAKLQAADILHQMSAELTRSGQFSQAAAITLMQNDPMTAMRYMEKEIETLNRLGDAKYSKWKKLGLTEDEVSRFGSIDAGDKDAIDALYTDIRKRLSKEVPSSTWEKIVSVEKTAMLLNPLTHIRNVVANVMLMPVRSTTDRISAIGQNISHLINPDVKVTQSLVGGGREEKKIAEEFFESIKDSVLGNNKMVENGANQVMRNKQVFKDDIFGKWVNKVTNGGIEKLNAKFGKDVEGNLFETLSNFNTWLMGEVEDDPFVKKNFVNRLASYMKAQGIKNAEDIPEDAVSLAIEEAMKATFKDDNAMTALLSGVKNKTGKFGEVMLPFTKTPANLAMRALDYSPVGIVNSVKELKNTGDVSKFLDDLSKNLLGTAGIYFSYQMAKNGVLSGAYSDDKKEQAYQKANGEQEYAINLDKLGEFFGVDIPKGASYTFDWAQPTSIPMILGATINDAIQTSDKEDASIADYLTIGKNAGLAAFDKWFDLSPLQSLKEIMAGDGYGTDSIGENITQAITDFPGRMIPSVVGAVARTKDNTIRDSYDKTDAVASWKNSMMAKLPGLSEKLPASYDIWGRERTRSQSDAEKIAEQFYSPGKIGTDTSVNFDAELQRIAEATNTSMSDLVPSAAGRGVKIDNVEKALTNKEHSDYQKQKGSLSYDFANAIVNSNLSDAEKAEAISDAYSLADMIAKRDLFGYEIKTKKKEVEAYDKGGIEGYMKYLQSDEVKAKNLANDLDVGNSKAFQEAVKNGTEQEYAEAYKAITETSLGMNEDGEEKHLQYNDKTAKLYAEKGQQGLSTYADIKKSLPKDANDADLMDAISKSNLSDEEKAYYYVNMRSHKLGKIPESFDNDYDKYQYYVIKDLLDADDNGSLTKAEKSSLSEVLAANGYDEAYIQKVVDGEWFGSSSSKKSGSSGSSKKKSSSGSLKSIGTTHSTSRSNKLHYTSMNPLSASSGVPTLFSNTYNNKDWYTKSTKKIPSLRG